MNVHQMKIVKGHTMAGKAEKKPGGTLTINVESAIGADALDETRTVVGTSSDGLPIELNVVQQTNATAANGKISDQAHIILRVPGADGFRYFIGTQEKGRVDVGPMSHNDSAPANSQFAYNRYGNGPRPNNANVGSDAIGLGLDGQLRKAALSAAFGRTNGADVPVGDFDALAKIARQALSAVKITPAPTTGKQI